MVREVERILLTEKGKRGRIVRSAIERKCISFIIASQILVIGFLLGSRVASTSASTTHPTDARPSLTNMVVAEEPGEQSQRDGVPGGDTSRHFLREENLQQNNQSYQGNKSGSSSSYVGSNQGNSGNQGINQGNNQDNGSNAGNLVSSQRKPLGYQENNQYYQGNTGGGNNASYKGNNQGNSGNQGANQGNNQDNSNNNGNQVNNQGTTIGTQINHQAREVNNGGSTIEHQVNYVKLVPDIQFNLNLFSEHPFPLDMGRGSSLWLPIDSKIPSSPR